MKEHQELVRRLEKSGKDIEHDLLQTGHFHKKLSLLHHSFALLIELGELIEGRLNYATEQAEALKNVIEELGDIEYYLEGIRQNLGLNYFHASHARHKKMPTNFEQELQILFFRCCELSDKIKKNLIYNQTLNLEECQVIYDIIINELLIIYSYFTTRQHILEQNIEKLNRRYPKGYSNKSAQERLDKNGTS